MSEQKTSLLDSSHDVRGKELHKLELQISHLLRRGVLLAGLFLLVGWLWMSFDGIELTTSLAEYKPQSFVDTIHWSALTEDRATILILAGLVILIALPIIRVFLTALLFFKQRDFRLAMMAIAVFGALVLSLFLGIDL